MSERREATIMSEEVHYRPLEHQDKPQLKVGDSHLMLKLPNVSVCEQLAHYDLFPVDYDDNFFEIACQGGTKLEVYPCCVLNSLVFSI